jgi:invasion protein IalB
MKTLGTNPDGTPAVEVDVVRLPANVPAVAGVTILTPLGVLLQPGMVTQVDSNAQATRNYQICTNAGCIARYALDAEELASHQRGNTLNLAVWAVNVPQNPIQVTVSLRGFTAAFAALRPQQLP